MRLFRRDGEPDRPSGPPLDARLADFWAWWSEVRDGLDRAFEAGELPSRVDEIAQHVAAIDDRLAWELGKGAESKHAFVVSPEGNPEVRPVALAWLASAPPADSLFEFHASRQPGPLATLGIGDLRVELGRMRALATWDEGREVLDVKLWHEAFTGLPDQVRMQLLFLFLDALLGEDEVSRWIGSIDVAEAAATGLVPEQLRAEVQRHAAEATGERFALAQGQAPGGEPVLVRFNQALKRIDHPFHGEHVAVSVERGIEHFRGTNELEAVDDAENRLIEALSGVAVEAARVTEARRRTTHLVARDAELAKEIAGRWAAEHPEYGPRVEVAADPHWEFRTAWTG